MAMEIKNFAQEGHTIVEMSGSLDSNTVAQAEEKIMPLVVEKACMVMDLTKCNYISSAGLRLLLMIAKQLSGRGGWLTLAGLCEEVKDVMEMTGFSCFFKCYSSVTEALEAIRKGK
jgi:anti-anti-sigma factor